MKHTGTGTSGKKGVILYRRFRKKTLKDKQENCEQLERYGIGNKYEKIVVSEQERIITVTCQYR
jgi:hypothetical protein